MKHIALIALLPCMAFADPCPDKPNPIVSKRKPCASWTPVTMRENGRPLPPEQLAGYVLYWEKTLDGKTERGQIDMGKATQYYFKNANRNASYRFWVVTHDTSGETSVNSQVGTWGKQ